MKQKIIILNITVFFFIISSYNIFSEETISPGKSKEIIEKIISNFTAYNKKYDGIEYLRKEEIKEYDPSGDKLLSKSNLLISRREYYSKESEYTVIKYEKNGKEMKPADYKERPNPALHQVFDEKGQDQYNISIIGFEIIEEQQCYKIKVTPKEATERHFKGYYYFSTEDLAPVLVDFTLGKLPFPLKEFSVKAYLSVKEDYVFTRNFKTVIRIKIPLVLDKRFVQTGKTLEAKPIIPYYISKYLGL